MNKPLLVAVSTAAFCIAGFATHVSAQEKTRAEVRQELIEAQNHGLRFVTDTSYPAVSPLFEQQAARMQRQPENSGIGSHAAGSFDAGKPAACIGPVSYCTIYFGS